jgi:hypothetical protein
MPRVRPGFGGRGGGRGGFRGGYYGNRTYDPRKKKANANAFNFEDNAATESTTAETADPINKTPNVPIDAAGITDDFDQIMLGVEDNAPIAGPSTAVTGLEGIEGLEEFALSDEEISNLSIV